VSQTDRESERAGDAYRVNVVPNGAGVPLKREEPAKAQGPPRRPPDRPPVRICSCKVLSGLRLSREKNETEISKEVIKLTIHARILEVALVFLTLMRAELATRASSPSSPVCRCAYWPVLLAVPVWVIFNTTNEERKKERIQYLGAGEKKSEGRPERQPGICKRGGCSPHAASTLPGLV